MEAENEYIVIRGYGAISSLGYDKSTTSKAYLAGKPAFSTIQHQNQPTPVARLRADAEQKLQYLLDATPNYKHLDRSVLMAVYAAREAAAQAGWLHMVSHQQHDLGINIGSSRGATGLLEQHYEAFQKESLSSGASPTTTLGNLSSWVAHAVNAGGAQISHSMTCSTALIAIANGAAWLKAGMAKRFLAGGTEAPLTNFTIAQMKAVGIYSKLHDHPYPCQPFAHVKQNTFVLGEGAAVFALERVTASEIASGDVIVEAVGLGFEKIESKTGISAKGENFQQSMRHALEQLSAPDRSVDAIVTHSPGTYAGDKAEAAAIAAVFQSAVPYITTNKWLLGHTLGASGALSMQYGLFMLENQQAPPLPDFSQAPPKGTSNYRRIMINAAGFGGNAASILLRKV